METSKNLENLLRDQLSSDVAGINPPNLSTMKKARELVRRRSYKVVEREDIFTLLAYFLNLRIKLYHAVIASIVIYAAVLFFRKEKPAINTEISSKEKVSNLASVRNSTVLSSIQTFVLPN